MSASLPTFERLKGKLKSSEKGEYDLYTHITEMLNRILLHHPYDAYQRFEEISQLCKKTHLKIKQPLSDQDLGKLKDKSEVSSEFKEVYQETKSLLDVNKSKARVKLGNVPDILADSRLFEWAGVGFGEEKTYKISLSLKRLAKETQAKNLRFWGKIYGIQKDYFIAEGEVDGSEEIEIPENQEKRGEGANKYVYWVTDNYLQDWVQLPDVRPEHIITARLLKHVFTGNLNESVKSIPSFPGKERHLLRAQIARISHGSRIVPKGIYGPNDENDKEIDFAETAEIPPTQELTNTENWVHLYPNLLLAGRVIHQMPKAVGEDDPETLLEAIKETDPYIDRLKEINADTPYLKTETLETSYLSKIVGDNQQFNFPDPPGGTAGYGVNVLKSLRWPGAVTVAQNGRYASIYVGYGHKAGGVSFNPIDPPAVLEEPQDQFEQPEPNPLKAPVEPFETDTDKEKNPDNADGDDDS